MGRAHTIIEAESSQKQTLAAAVPKTSAGKKLWREGQGREGKGREGQGLTVGLELGEVPEDGAEGRALAGRVAEALRDERGQLLAGRLGQAVPLLVETLFLGEKREKKNKK